MKKTKLVSVLEILAGIFLAPVVQQVAAEYLTRKLGLLGAIAAAFLGVCLLALLWLGLLGAWRLVSLRRLRARLSFGEARAEKSDIVVLTFSRPEHADKLLQYHRPRRMYLIATSGGQAASGGLAEEWRAQKTGEVRDGIIVSTDVTDAFDASQTQAVAKRIFDELETLNVSPERVSADITGGTVAMSIGLFAEAVSRGVHVTYMPQRTDREGRGVELLDPRKVEITLESASGWPADSCGKDERRGNSLSGTV
ncbi:MAG: hypothetical protein H5T86_12635 [Armatimonadetes bacterium]|nr:hypothetical protein [Armatimonadota bacterium]